MAIYVPGVEKNLGRWTADEDALWVTYSGKPYRREAMTKADLAVRILAVVFLVVLFAIMIYGRYGRRG